MPFSRLKRFFEARARESDSAHKLYVAAVRQAREPAFYTHCGVADTLDGRFDLIVLHVFFVIRALREAGGTGERLGKHVFKVLIDDMDLNLREIGVGDLGVGKRVKAMARAYYGRAKAYDAALDAEKVVGPLAANGASLEDALRRNIYGSSEPDPRQVAALAAYVRATNAALAGQALSGLLEGRIQFASAPTGAYDGDLPSARSSVLERVDP